MAILGSNCVRVKFLLGIGWITLLLVFLVLPSSAAAQTPYNPYDLQWVTNGFVFDQPFPVTSAVAGHGLDGTTHYVFFSVDANQVTKLYYTNNAYSSGDRGWLPSEQVNVQSEPESTANQVQVDGSGTAHIAWSSKPVASWYGNLSDFQNSVTDTWYRSRTAGGVWSAETRVTDYRSQVAMIAANNDYCNYGFPNPHIGRQIWARPAVVSLVMGVESNGTPRFAWYKEWKVLAFDPVTGEVCNSGPNLPPIPPAYQSRTVTAYGIGGGEQVFSETVIGYPAILAIDRADNAHLFVQVLNQFNAWVYRYYAFAGIGGGWSVPTQLPDYQYLDTAPNPDDPANALHVIAGFGGFPTPPTLYFKIINGVWQSFQSLPSQGGYAGRFIVVDRDGQPFVTMNDSSLYSLFDGQWQKISSYGMPYGKLYIDERGVFTVPTGGGYVPNQFDVYSTSLLHGTGKSENTVAVSDNILVNVTNGDLGITIPLFSLSGIGPQESVGLTYNTLSRPTLMPDSLSGWRLTPLSRLLNSNNSDCCLDRAWITAPQGETVALTKERYPSIDFYTSYQSEPFLLLNQDVTTRIWTVKDASGRESTFLKSGQIETRKDSSGNTLTYSYEDNPLASGVQENPVRLVDAKGRTTRFEYDANNLLVKIFDPENHKYDLAYYGLNETDGGKEQRLLKSLTRVRTDGPNEVWQFTYHAATDAAATCPGNSSLACPAKRAFLKTIQNPRGFITSLYYERGGRFARAVNASQATLDMRYEKITAYSLTACAGSAQVGNSLRTRVTDSRGNTTIYESAEETGTVWKMTDSLGYSTEQRFASYFGEHGRLLCAKDKRGFVTTFDWLQSPPADFVKFQLSDIHEPGITNPIHYTYTAEHEIATVTDPKGNTTTNLYADSNNPHLITSIIEPADKPGDPHATTVITYDALGRMRTKTDPKGTGITTYTYDVVGDETGLPTSIQRAGLTGLEKFTYTRMGFLNTHKEPAHPDSIVTDNDYDDANRLVRITFPDSGTGGHGSSAIMNTYDALGNLETVTDQLGKVTIYAYDVLNRQVRVTRQDGTFSRTEYDTNGNVTAVVDWNGNRTGRDYDSLNRLIEELRPENIKMRFGYDENGNVVQQKEIGLDGSERSTVRTFDQLNRLTSVADPSPFYAQTENFTYDDDSNVTTVTDRRGTVTEHRYTNRNLLSSIKRNGALPDPEYQIDYDYDLNGNPIITGVWRNDGVWTRHDTVSEYDALNRLITTTDPLSRATALAYDDNSNLTDTTDPAGMVTHATYDNLNRKKTNVADFGRLNLTSRTVYDAAGNVVASIDAENRTTAYIYDDLHRLTTVTSPLGLVLTYTYDANDNKRLVTDGLNHTTEYTYDGLNRLVSERDASGVVNQIRTYDEFGNPKTRLDGNGVTTTYTYDKLHRLKETIYPTYRITRTYDENGNLKTIVDPTTNESYDYDRFNRLIRTTDHILNRSLEYNYDAYDNRKQLRVYRSSNLEQTLDYRYDVAGQIDTIAQGANIFDYDFNPDGTRRKLTRPNSTFTDYLYDTGKRLTDLNNKKQDSFLISGFHYTPDVMGNRTAVEVSWDGLPRYTVNYQYDELYRLKDEARTGDNPYSYSFTYDLAGNRRTQTRNGVQTVYGYDDANQLRSAMTPGRMVSDSFENGVLDGWTVIDGLWQEAEGVLQGMNDRIGVKRTASLKRADIPTTDPKYRASVLLSLPTDDSASVGMLFHVQDGNNYLAAEIEKLRDLSSAFLPPNRRQFQTTYALRLVKVVDGVPVKLARATFNDLGAGRTLRLEVDRSSVKIFVRDQLLITQNSLPWSDGEIGLFVTNTGYFDDFRYDASEITSYGYDRNGNLVQENSKTYGYDFENRLTRFSDAPTSGLYTYDALGRRISKSVNGTSTERYYYEGNDAIRDLDTNGNVVTRYVNGLGIDERLAMAASSRLFYYLTDALNSTREVIDTSGTVLDRYDYEAFGLPLMQLESVPNRYQFTGREWDQESGKDYYRARMYDPAAGRFMGRDAKMTDVNLYAYASNNPANLVDPMGLDDQKLTTSVPPVSEELPPLEAAALSDRAYTFKKGQTVGIGTHFWHAIKVFEKSGSGLRAVLFESGMRDDKRAVLAFAGTKPSSFVDIFTDRDQLSSESLTQQYAEAYNIAWEVRRDADKLGIKLYFTGHSLGGGISEYCSLCLDIPATAFNAAPLGEATRRDIAETAPKGASNKVTHYVVAGEFASASSLAGGKRSGVIHTLTRPGTIPIIRHLTNHFIGNVIELIQSGGLETMSTTHEPFIAPPKPQSSSPHSCEDAYPWGWCGGVP